MRTHQEPMEYQPIPMEEMEEMGSQNFRVDLIERLFNTPKDRMAELTFIPKGQAAEIARAMTMAQMFNPDRHEYEWREVRVKTYALDENGEIIIGLDGNPYTVEAPVYDEIGNPVMEKVMTRYVTLLEIFIENLFRINRSIDGKMVSFAAMLAETQSDTEDEEPLREF